MDPGHVCVIVKLPEGDYYAEVGYAAPFFKAKPLMTSFIATSPLEIFKYEVKGDKIIVTRTPGPTKTLILRAQTPAEINAHFEKLNDPNTSKFLQSLTISKFFNKKIVRLTGDKLIGDGPERIVPEDEIEDLLITKFRIHPSFYQRARTKMK